MSLQDQLHNINLYTWQVLNKLTTNVMYTDRYVVCSSCSSTGSCGAAALQFMRCHWHCHTSKVATWYTRSESVKRSDKGRYAATSTLS